MANISTLSKRWKKDKEFFKTKEIGELQDFVKDILESEDIFGLKKGVGSKSNSTRTNEFTIETGKNGRRADFVVFVDGEDIVIPVEVERHNNIKKGEVQIAQYQKDWNKKYGILTDGNEWRFYKSLTVQKTFFIEDIFSNSKDFVDYWKEYIKPENYYLELLSPITEAPTTQQLDLNLLLNRVVFFEEITQVINNFKNKMKSISSNLLQSSDKVAIEVSYAYLIQFILYKVLVDNEFKTFRNEYDEMFRKIQKALKSKDFYSIIINEIKNLSEYISDKIYSPFKEEQKDINKKLIENLKQSTITIEDIAPWLDIVIFINRYNFAGLKNEIFGFIYENFLKDLYQDTNKGQYFTDPAVVNFMLKEVGYTKSFISSKTSTNKISIIDPSCGAGTFLYSAVDKIVEAFNDGTKEKSVKIEELVDKNIFGLDIEEFPLYLAEMNILMRLLPLIVNDNFENPINNKLKIFKTKDSISEFLNVGITSKEDKIDLFSNLKERALPYNSFMRDEKDLENMLKSMQKECGIRERFDFVIGNPPYIGYNQCCGQKIEFTKKIKDKKDRSITMGDVYGMNLHSVPNSPKKYGPKPNLYTFFIALGLGLLKDGGKISYIIPQTILTETDYDVVRYHLSKFTTIEKIITFSGNLFIGRGLKQNKPVSTSSLIFIVRKEAPPKNHRVKIINYNSYLDKNQVDFDKYIKSRNKQTKEISQRVLLQNYLNWSFLKLNKEVVSILNKYNSTENKSLEMYYNHKISKKIFGDLFYFDAGFTLDKSSYMTEESGDCYKLLQLKDNIYTIKKYYFYSKNEKIRIPQGSQGFKAFDLKYKIIWKKMYAGNTKFAFTDSRDIILDTNMQFISSNNRSEIIFLQSLLNSELNIFILKKLLKLGNEKIGIFIVIKRIKNFIRVPKISQSNLFIKDEIINQTEMLLSLEEYQLKDFIDFDTQIQKFSSIEVSGSDLLLIDMSNNLVRQKITSNHNLVRKIIKQLYPQGRQSINLHDLKFTEAIDMEEQAVIKDYIDDLVFCLYFNLPIKNIGLNEAKNIKNLCIKNESYNYIYNKNKRKKC